MKTILTVYAKHSPYPQTPTASGKFCLAALIVPTRSCTKTRPLFPDMILIGPLNGHIPFQKGIESKIINCKNNIKLPYFTDVDDNIQ